MSDPNQRLTAWKIKTDTGKVKEILDTIRPDMLKHYEAAVASLCEMETKARQTLNAAGVHTIMYVPYLSYARQLYKLSRQQGISGESFALGAEVLVPEMGRPRPGFCCTGPNPYRSLRRRRSRAIGPEPCSAHPCRDCCTLIAVAAAARHLAHEQDCVRPRDSDRKRIRTRYAVRLTCACRRIPCARYGRAQEGRSARASKG